MEFKNILKRRKNKKSKMYRDPNNDIPLAELMQKSAAEPAFRPTFFRRLLAEQVYVVVTNRDLPLGEIDTDKVKEVGFMSLPDGRVPIFTSVERISDKGFIGAGARYITIRGGTLLASNPKQKFIINPFSDYARNLFPEEIEKILAGNNLYDQSHTQEFTPADRKKILLGIPSVYPWEVMDDLIKMYREYPEIDEAYVAIIKHLDSDRTPNYIFAIRTQDLYNEIASETGILVQKAMKDNQIFEIVRLDGDTFFEGFFKNTLPFYKRGL